VTSAAVVQWQVVGSRSGVRHGRSVSLSDDAAVAERLTVLSVVTMRAVQGE